MSDFTLDSTMKEVEARFPFSRSLLHSKFHVGGCQSCGYLPEESVREVAQKHSKDGIAMVETLNSGFAEMQRSEISPEELQTLLSTNENVLLLDVRETWEFDLCHLSNALRLSEENMEETMRKASQTRHVIVYCHHGVRSLNATLFFKNNGIPQACSLKGGIDAYSLKIDPTIQRY
jgi:rhodanese-related sulfurtransferase